MCIEQLLVGGFSISVLRCDEPQISEQCLSLFLEALKPLVSERLYRVNDWVHRLVSQQAIISLMSCSLACRQVEFL